MVSMVVQRRYPGQSRKNIDRVMLGSFIILSLKKGTFQTSGAARALCKPPLALSGTSCWSQSWMGLRTVHLSCGQIQTSQLVTPTPYFLETYSQEISPVEHSRPDGQLAQMPWPCFSLDIWSPSLFLFDLSTQILSLPTQSNVIMSLSKSVFGT